MANENTTSSSSAAAAAAKAPPAPTQSEFEAVLQAVVETHKIVESFHKITTAAGVSNSYTERARLGLSMARSKLAVHGHWQFYGKSSPAAK